MKKRSKMKPKQSKKLFSKTAGARNTHPKNTQPQPMRGGYRL